MISLAFGLNNDIELNGKIYQLDLDFSTVLMMFEMFQDDDLEEGYKFAGVLLGVGNLSEEEIKTMSDQERIDFYQAINERITGSVVNIEPERDLAGNIIQSEISKEDYNLVEDASYIFASFYKDYKIDLVDSRGSLHWDKFNALLISLSDETKFKKIVEIRQTKETSDMDSEQKTALRKAKKAYALKSTQKSIEFEEMDLVQKREWFIEQQEKRGEIIE